MKPKLKPKKYSTKTQEFMGIKLTKATAEKLKKIQKTNHNLSVVLDMFAESGFELTSVMPVIRIGKESQKGKFLRFEFVEKYRRKELEFKIDLSTRISITVYNSTELCSDSIGNPADSEESICDSDREFPIYSYKGAYKKQTPIFLRSYRRVIIVVDCENNALNTLTGQENYSLLTFDQTNKDNQVTNQVTNQTTNQVTNQVTNQTVNQTNGE